jgi:hypothetical protein
MFKVDPETGRPWEKADESGGFNNCMEISPTGDPSMPIEIRNQTFSPDSIFATRGEFGAFLAAAKRGQFDHLVE